MMKAYSPAGPEPSADQDGLKDGSDAGPVADRAGPGSNNGHDGRCSNTPLTTRPRP